MDSLVKQADFYYKNTFDGSKQAKKKITRRKIRRKEKARGIK